MPREWLTPLSWSGEMFPIKRINLLEGNEVHQTNNLSYSIDRPILCSW